MLLKFYYLSDKRNPTYCCYRMSTSNLKNPNFGFSFQTVPRNEECTIFMFLVTSQEKRRISLQVYYSVHNYRLRNSLQNLTHFKELKISQRYSQQAGIGAYCKEPKFVLHPRRVLLTYVFTLPSHLLPYLSNDIFSLSFKLNFSHMLHPCHHHSLSHPNTLSVTFHLHSFYILRHLVYNK